MKKSLWQNKNFTLNFFGALVSNIGAVCYSFAVSFYILKITENNSAIQGAYLAVVGIVSLIVMLFGGVIADRFNKVRIMYLCDYLKGGILAITTVVMIFSPSVNVTLIALFAAGILGSIVSSFFTPASSALLPLIVEEEQLQKANSYFSLLQSVQSIAGVLLAGVLYSLLPITVLFFIVAGCYVASAISEMFIRYDYVKNDTPLTLKSTFKELGLGFSYIFKNKALLSLTICVVFINFFFNPIFSNFLPYFISCDVTGTDYLFSNFLSSEMWQSILEIVFSIGMIIGSIIVGIIHYKRASKPTTIGITMLSIAVLSLALSYFFLIERNGNINAYLIVLCVLSLLVGFALPITNIPVNTSLQKITSKDMLGKVSAVLNVFSSSFVPLSSLIAGLIISGLGSSFLLFVCAAGFVITTLIIIFNKPIKTL